MRKLFLLALISLITFTSAKSDDKSPWKFSGTVYMDYLQNIGRDTSFFNKAPGSVALTGARNTYGFYLRRIYFTADYDFGNNFSSRFRLETDNATQVTNGKFAPSVKDFWVKWKDIFHGSDLIVGLQPTLGYDVSEGLWGYRSLEKTQMDLRGWLPSRDFAATLKGKFDGDGMFNYAIQYGNNNGNDDPSITSTPSSPLIPPSSVFTSIYKRVSGLLYIKPVNNLHVTLYGEETFAAADKNHHSPNVHNYDFVVAWSDPKAITVGADIAMHSVDNSYVKTGATDSTALNGMGMSFFARYFFMPELEGIVRFDIWDPNTDSADKAKGDSRNYLIVGLNWKVNPNVWVIPNLQYEMLETLPASISPTKADLKLDPSVTARITIQMNW